MAARPSQFMEKSGRTGRSPGRKEKSELIEYEFDL